MADAAGRYVAERKILFLADFGRGGATIPELARSSAGAWTHLRLRSILRRLPGRTLQLAAPAIFPLASTSSTGSSRYYGRAAIRGLTLPPRTRREVGLTTHFEACCNLDYFGAVNAGRAIPVGPGGGNLTVSLYLY